MKHWKFLLLIAAGFAAFWGGDSIMAAVGDYPNEYADIIVTAPSATTSAGLRIGHGTAPTTPTNGDVWTTTSGFYTRINGTTQGPYIYGDVALGTGTSGNYVASVATGTGLTGGAAGSEGAALTLSLSHLGIQSLTDPNADTLMFWDDSDGAVNWATLQTRFHAVSSGDLLYPVFNAATGDVSFLTTEGGWCVNGLIFEGTTADAIETRFQVADPTGTDKTITVQDKSGTLKVSTPIWLYAGNATPATTGGAAAAALDANDHWVVSFGKDEYCFWSIPLPSDFDGTIENINFLWYMSSATEAVTWSLAVRTFADGGAMNTAYGSENSASADTAGAVDQEQRTSLTAASLLGSTANLRAEIRCKATTTAGSFTNEPKLLGVVMEY